ncbi:MAG: DUF2752 domain-containing protein [Flavobacteriaceae bacterium]
MANLEDYMLPCVTKKYLGIECMGCGLQRSLLFFLKGDFIGAFHMYPAIYTLLPLVFIIFLNLFYKIKHYNKIINLLAILSVVIIITSFIIKKSIY